MRVAHAGKMLPDGTKNQRYFEIRHDTTPPEGLQKGHKFVVSGGREALPCRVHQFFRYN